MIFIFLFSHFFLMLYFNILLVFLMSDFNGYNNNFIINIFLMADAVGGI